MKREGGWLLPRMNENPPPLALGAREGGGSREQNETSPPPAREGGWCLQSLKTKQKPPLSRLERGGDGGGGRWCCVPARFSSRPRHCRTPFPPHKQLLMAAVGGHQ